MNNVYVRGNKTLSNIVLTRMFFLIPLMLYGCYKNGIYLYIHKYVGIYGLFKPFIIIIGSILISIIIDYIYEKIIKKEKFYISFNLEYAILLSLLISINVNIFLYFIVLITGLIIIRFSNYKFNITSLMFITIYLLTKNYTNSNIYEIGRTFDLNIIDCLLGKSIGGIGSTHIILLIVAMIGMKLMDCNKDRLVISSLIPFAIGTIVISLTKKLDYFSLITSNNYLFCIIYVITSYPASPYTKRGMEIYGILSGMLTILIYFINPILAPFISIFIMSIFRNLIDNKNK